MAVSFHAGFVEPNKLCHRLSFADRNDESAEHYFIMDRMEGSLEEAVPDMDNVYIERDDQQWGGFGGIKRVVLDRTSLTIYLGTRMARQMGNHKTIRITFTLNQFDFGELCEVLDLI